MLRKMNLFLLLCCVVPFISLSNAVGNTSYISEVNDVQVNRSRGVLLLHESVNTSTITEPILKPKQTTQEQASTQIIDATIVPAFNSSHFLSLNKTKSKFSDFRPSPQLHENYEYNKVPVVPALPEAKLSPNSFKMEALPWVGKKFHDFIEGTPSPWHGKVKFPTNSPTIGYKDHPYPYESNVNEYKSGNGFGASNNDNQNGDLYPTPLSLKFTTPQNENWNSFDADSFERGTGYHQKEAPDVKDFPLNHGYTYDAPTTNAVKKRPIMDKTNYEYGLEKPNAGIGLFPWKKIIKFLTAVIPFGLLLSALTPTVINVTPVNNNTWPRGRSHEENTFASKLVSSLNYISNLKDEGCEERIICELLMGAATTENREKNIENLLEAFTEEEKDTVKKIDELKIILEAVRTGDCKSLLCNDIKPTNKQT